MGGDFEFLCRAGAGLGTNESFAVAFHRVQRSWGEHQRFAFTRCRGVLASQFPVPPPPLAVPVPTSCSQCPPGQHARPAGHPASVTRYRLHTHIHARRRDQQDYLRDRRFRLLPLQCLPAVTLGGVGQNAPAALWNPLRCLCRRYPMRPC